MSVRKSLHSSRMVSSSMYIYSNMYSKRQILGLSRRLNNYAIINHIRTSLSYHSSLRCSTFNLKTQGSRSVLNSYPNNNKNEKENESATENENEQSYLYEQRKEGGFN